jgi:uncharacterized protein YjbI with pentapeptide repeats
MEARRFDAVTKALGTRRRVLRGLVAGIGGGALIGPTGRQASADECCKELHKRLKADCQACGGHLSKFDCGKTQSPGTCGALSDCSGCDEEAATQVGAAGGRLGGRHGQNRRGRDRDRSHGDQKSDKQDRKKKQENGKDQDGGVFGIGDGSRDGLRDCSQVPRVPGADLSNCDLAGVDLTRVNLEVATLSNADLTGATLRAAFLVDATMFKATLTGANLTVADLRGANLTGADLGDANLEDADLTDATLRGANLTRANLMFTFFCRTTMPDGSINNADCPGGV